MKFLTTAAAATGTVNIKCKVCLYIHIKCIYLYKSVFQEIQCNKCIFTRKLLKILKISGQLNLKFVRSVLVFLSTNVGIINFNEEVINNRHYL